MMAKKQKDKILDQAFSQFAHGKKLAKYDQEEQVIMLKKHSFEEEQKVIR
jgi:hypothetical protein